MRECFDLIDRNFFHRQVLDDLLAGQSHFKTGSVVECAPEAGQLGPRELTW